MPQPHVLVADWIEDFDLEREWFERSGVSWSLPSWRLPPPPRDQQRRQLLERIAAAPG